MNEETSTGAQPQVQARGQDAAMQTETRRASMTTENTPDPAAPDTIVLVHGLWVTPRSWESGSSTTRTRDTVWWLPHTRASR